VVEQLILNRLHAPRPLYDVERWALETGIEEVFTLKAAKLNDDRLGAALDAMHEHLDAIQDDICLEAIKQFKLNIRKIHYDLTSCSVFGTYAEQATTAVQVEHGYSRKKRPDLKQVMVGLSVTADGQVPMHQKAHDGSTADEKTYWQHFKALQQTLKTRNLLIIGDCKLATAENMVSIATAGGYFLSTAALDAAMRALLASRKVTLADFVPLPYVSHAEKQRPTAERTVYKGYEAATCYVHWQGQSVLVRNIFIYSSTKQRQDVEARQKGLTKLAERLAQIQRLQNKYKYKTAAYSWKQVQTCLASHAAGKYFQVEIHTDAHGLLQMHYHLH
jgi:transposase